MDGPTARFEGDALILDGLTPEEARRIEQGIMDLARAIEVDTPARRFGKHWGGASHRTFDDNGV